MIARRRIHYAVFFLLGALVAGWQPVLAVVIAVMFVSTIENLEQKR